MVDSDTLRALQAPIKDRYRAEPASARITLKAAGTLDSTEIACNVETARAIVAAGLHPGTGGSGSFACSGDMLLQALVACAGVTLKAVATALGIELTDARVFAEGDLDFRGTLGVERSAPVGFSDIRLRFEVASPAPQDQIDRLLALTERYCVVYQTLRSPPNVAAELKRA